MFGRNDPAWPSKVIAFALAAVVLVGVAAVTRANADAVRTMQERPDPAPRRDPAIDEESAASSPDRGSMPYSAVPQRSATLDQLEPSPTAVPVLLQIGALRVEAPIVPVSVEPDDGDLAVPPSAGTVAWYQHGPTPGEPGSTVLAAHVDWHGERGVFFELADLPVGAVATVTMADGRRIGYTVTSREQVDKAALPVDQIFARDGEARLVLVTCGGAFDRRSRSYADNIVVSAVRTGP